VYKRDHDEPADFSGCIEHFLVANVLASPIVQNSRLTDIERNELDSPLTIAELDKSLEPAKLLGLDICNFNTDFNASFTAIHKRIINLF
jgi:hypothetical protein